jgi:hypothetical protein
MSASPLLAYHGNPKLKRMFLARVRAHVKADQLIQGYGYWKDGKGCAVGCTVHLDLSGTAHQAYPRELGIPEELAYLEDHLFESLDVKRARAWPAQFLSAITPGADLSRVYGRWSAWNLIDPVDGVITLVTDDFPDVQRIVRETGAACEAGDRVSAARAAEAAWAAGAAEAAEAAWAAGAAGAARAAGAAGAAWAAEAAWAAGVAWATWAAEAAGAARAAGAAEAAWAAWAAEAAWAARAAYHVRAADKLIELLKATS